MQDNFIFPAVFSYDADGISISFPDLPGCFTCASTDEEALYMAKDALRGHLLVMEDFDEEIPSPTPIHQLTLEQGEVPSLISVTLAGYREAYNNKSVKKTLTIPKWLNDLAEKENINFSFILQSALKKQLNL